MFIMGLCVLSDNTETLHVLSNMLIDKWGLICLILSKTVTKLINYFVRSISPKKFPGA